MDYQLLTLLITIIVLQLIVLSMVDGIRRQRGGRGDFGKRPGAPGGDRSQGVTRRDNAGGRKQGDNRAVRPQQSRPQQSQGSQSQGSQSQGSTAAAMNPVETLRDINLKLKNAEREQENVRKKIQDGGGWDSGRDGYRQYGERGDRGGRNRVGRRDFNRDRNGEGRPDRPPRREPPFAQAEPEPKAPEITVNDAGADDQLQHGRKFTAKRRPLPETPDPAAPEPVTTETTAAQNREPAGENPSFGGNPHFSDYVNDNVQDNVQNQAGSMESSVGSTDIRYGR